MYDIKEEIAEAERSSSSESDSESSSEDEKSNSKSHWERRVLVCESKCIIRERERLQCVS